ncbi:MAG: YicC/YloC family endoribonuclease [Clostridiaceae bacterium]
MVSSMTGFGRGTSETEEMGYTIEIKSVNHRYLDLNIKLPKSLISLEGRIRREIQNKINRGKIDLFLTQNVYQITNEKAIFNKEVADSYVTCLKDVKERYDALDDISVSLISRFPEVITLAQKGEDLESSWGLICRALNEAIDKLNIMRTVEGEKLKEDILIKLMGIENMVLKVEEKAPQVPLIYKEKLQNRLKELLENNQIDESRLYSEVTMFSDRSCIDEEIVRLKSHISQLKSTFSIDEPIGRKLDFIVQEMNRETNTIGSKANDLEITKYVLEMKNDIEKIREQIQNIE